MAENELNELSKEVKLISTKELTKGLINNYSILNSGKYFGENESQNYLVLQPLYMFAFLHLNMMKLVHDSQKECQKKVLHLHPQQTKVLIQK